MGKLKWFVNICLILTFFSFISYGYEYELAVFQTNESELYEKAVDGFIEEIRSMGYKEAENTRTAYYNMNNDEAESEQYIDEIIELPSSLVYAVGSGAAFYTKKKLTNIPVVAVLTPRTQKLNQQNITGVKMKVSIEDQIEQINLLFPEKKNIGVIHSDMTTDYVSNAKSIANNYSISIKTHQVQSEIGVSVALKSLANQIDILWLIPDPKVGNTLNRKGQENLKFIYRYCLTSKIPVIGFSPKHPNQGAFGAISISYEDVGRQAAGIADKILQGSSPSEISFQNPNPFIYVNKRIATLLKVDIPSDVMQNQKVIVK